MDRLLVQSIAGVFPSVVFLSWLLSGLAAAATASFSVLVGFWCCLGMVKKMEGMGRVVEVVVLWVWPGAR